jgi:hypothetical protein
VGFALIRRSSSSTALGGACRLADHADHTTATKAAPKTASVIHTPMLLPPAKASRIEAVQASTLSESMMGCGIAVTSPAVS